MKRKKIICFVLIGVISSIFILIYVLHHSANNIKVEILNDVFRFRHETAFEGNRWNLYINSSKKRLCSFIPSDGMTQEEMKNKLSEDIVILYNNQNIRVYCILDYIYYFEQSYPIVYTLNGNDFYLWNEDKDCSEADVEKRLKNLYKHISQEELVKTYIYSNINFMVENEALKGKEFVYAEKNDIKVCTVEDNGVNISYYAKNNDGVYASISREINGGYFELTYEKSSIKMRLSSDSVQYWCRVDYDLNPLEIDDDIYYNKIITCISAQELYDMNSCFYEYTVSMMDEYEIELK